MNRVGRTVSAEMLISITKKRTPTQGVGESFSHIAGVQEQKDEKLMSSRLSLITCNDT